MTNPGLGEENVIVPEASSTCEVLFGLLEEEKISKAAAEALYTGIAHDTGMFHHSCTSGKTMRIAGTLMEKGIDFTRIADVSFNRNLDDITDMNAALCFCSDMNSNLIFVIRKSCCIDIILSLIHI